MFIIRKFVMAKSAKDAINKERKQCVDEVWLQEDWFRQHVSKSMENKNEVGFQSKKIT